MKKLIIPITMAFGLFLMGQGLYMDAKAKVAQMLISSSWESRSKDSPVSKPWSWADTHVIARMDVPRLQEIIYVMADDSGESLAFGPGHMPASAQPSGDGHVVLAGHRDSHFEFLKNIKVGDLINTENVHANKKQYRVTELEIINVNEQEIPLLDYSQLTLITCYPFEDFIPGGPLRLVVHAEPVNIKV